MPAVLEGLTTQEAVQFLQDVLRINTTNPPGGEAALAEYLASRLTAEGLQAHVEPVDAGRANLIARLPGRRRSGQVVYAGHLDTVPPGSAPWQYDPFAAVEKNGRIYGRGASDMKSGLAAMALAMIALKRQGWQPGHDLMLVGTAGEEVNCLGAREFVKAGGMKDVGALVIGEPTGGDVIAAHKGAAWLEVITHGRTAHGSMPDLGVNAIEHMLDFLAGVREFRDSWQFVSDPLLGGPTMSWNRIDGGVATNVVPDRCVCRLDIRLVPGQVLNDVLKPLTGIIVRLNQTNPQFQAEINVLNYLVPVRCPEGDGILAVAEAVANKVSPVPVRVRGINYYTDASVLLADRLRPVFLYGPGEAGAAHQPDESVTVEKYCTAIQFFAEFAKEYIQE